MKLTLEMYDKKYSVESSANDYTSPEMKETFSRLLVCAGYNLNTIEFDDGARYEIIEENETIIKQERLNELLEKEKQLEEYKQQS